MSYIGKSPTGTGVRSRYYYTATGGETSISGADDSGATLTFTDGAYVDVYLNGVLLVAGTDYNTSTANTIGGLAALAGSDIVEVLVYDTFTVADVVKASSGGTFNGGVTVNGTVTATAFSGDGSGLTGVEAFPSGTLMLFQQTAAPTGWTKQTTHNDKALRVVSGTAGSGGSTAFTTALGTPAVSGSVSLSGNISDTTLSTAQMPSHNHGFREGDTGNNVAGSMRRSNTAALQTDNGIILSAGGGGSHNHGHNLAGSLSSATTAINVQYVDLIIASKD